MKLYWSQNSCAIEVAALLEEAGLPYAAEKVDARGGALRVEPFRTMNPKGKVPILVRDDGIVITEYPTIVRWIARIRPEADLLPRDADDEMRASEIMDYVVGTVHGQGFRRIFFPQEFCKDDAHRDAVKADGREIARRAFEILGDQLGDRAYTGGDRFSIADASLFYTTRWAKLAKVELPANIAAFSERVAARPAFQTVLARMT